MLGVPSGFVAWTCPFCVNVAAGQVEQSVLCACRKCVCGAIGIAAPKVDNDEIVDDAIYIFGVRTREESRGYDALLLDDIRRTGVEIREGQRCKVKDGFWGEYKSLWFRKVVPSPPA